MKRTSINAALALILSAGLSTAQAPPKTTRWLEWEASQPAGLVAGYRIWRKVITPTPAPAPGAAPAEPVVSWELLGEVAAPTTEYNVEGVPPGVTTYTVTAYTAKGRESERSNECEDIWITPPGKLSLSITVRLNP